LGEVEDTLEVYDTPLNWRAVFHSKNLCVKSNIDLDIMKVIPKESCSEIVLEFSTRTLSDNIAEQKARKMVENFQTIATLFLRKPCIMEMVDLKCLNTEEIKGKTSIKVLTGESYYLKKILDPIELTEEQTNELEMIYNMLFGRRLITAAEYDAHYTLHTTLYWLGKSMQDTDLSDRLISLWIPFNTIYAYVWRKDHSLKRSSEGKMFRYLLIESKYFEADSCYKILENHPYMVNNVMRELPSKDYLIKEFGSVKKGKNFLNNPYGLNFWEYYNVEEWNAALAEVVDFIYGLRNGIFHGSWLPDENDLLQASVSILYTIIESALQKLLKEKIAYIQSHK
jgi:hypothetical protein